jgi:hypothetical protein
MNSAVLAATVIVSLSILSISPANADMTPSNPPVISNDSFKVAMEQFKRDRDLFIAAMHDRQMKLRDINLTFKNSVDKANFDARAQLASATTPVQKSTISAQRRSAIDTAINSRESAIEALGSMPVAPTEPIRPLKSSNEANGKKRN